MLGQMPLLDEPTELLLQRISAGACQLKRLTDAL
jgi:hypothetical protein